MELVRFGMRALRASLMLCTVAVSTTNAQVTVGIMQSGSGLPFASVANFNVNHYQQVFTASAFAGPLTIRSLSFFCTFALCDPTGAFAANTYGISLSTTSAAVGALSTTMSSNVGADATLFYSGGLTGNVGTGFSILGNPFSYDPTAGNLLLDIFITGPGTGGVAVDSDVLSSGRMSRVYGLDDAGRTDRNLTVGVVTGFNVNTGNVVGSAIVPEPGSFLLLAAGLAAMATATVARRRGH